MKDAQWPLAEKDFKPASMILNELSDGKWHRYTEIEEEVNLSSATISKYLKKLLNGGKIVKQTDPEDWRVSLYRIEPTGLGEIIRDKKLIDLKNMSIDLATEYDAALALEYSLRDMPVDLVTEYNAPFALEHILPKTLPDAKQLNILGWIELSYRDLYEKTESFLPRPKLKYTLFHQIGREISPTLKEMLTKYRFRWLLERLISEILSSVVISVYGKEPRFIEKISELIEWYRDAMNQRFVVVVDFDGKSIAEEVDWEKLKKETVQLGEEWNRHLRETYEKAVEEGRKRREDFEEKHPEEYEEWQRKLWSEETLKKLDEFNLRMMIDTAIMSISGEDFRSREEAIETVIEVMRDKKRLREEGFPDAFRVSLEGIDLKQAVEDYLSAVDKHPRPYQLRHREYRYPGTERVYDLYFFAPQPRKQLLSSTQKE